MASVVPPDTSKEEKVTTAILGYSWTSSFAQSFALLALGVFVLSQSKEKPNTRLIFVSGFMLLGAAGLSSVMTAELFKTKSLTYKV